jgi:dTDP-4-dehydrorhamnose reductase
MKVLVTGAGGQLGQAVASRFAPHHDVIACDHAALDLTRSPMVLETTRAVRPDAVINCAAYNNVDGAEDEAQQALAINGWAVRTLARAVRETGGVLVHYSTDFVFAGTAAAPYVETDTPSPQGAYAASKLIGEWFATDAPSHYVLRVESLFGGSRAKSSVDQLLAGILANRPVRVFADRAVSPSHVNDVADATRALLETRAPHGLYHCVNSGWTNWLDLTRHLATLAGRPHAEIIPTRLADAGLRVSRPLFAALSNDKLRGVGVTMPTWQDALARYVPIAIARAQP